MTGSLTYPLPTATGLVNEGWSETTLLRDRDDTAQQETSHTIDAQVKSGDYFVTLATKLDVLSKNQADYLIRVALEDIISDLIYLQDNYTISKNKPE